MELSVLKQMQGIEILYFFIALALGFLVARFLVAKWIKTLPSRELRYQYIGFAILFAIVSVLTLLYGSRLLPIWIGRNVIFFTGYYLGLLSLIGKKKKD